MTTHTAIFAAGCFWGVEDSFRAVPGVSNVTVGYTGGTVDDPEYKQVCNGDTGHAEAVLVEFNPDVVTYDQLLDLLFSIHNPTTLNRQGWDHGTQYRSAIFTNSEEQIVTAKLAIKRHQADHRKPIVTEITPATTFWRAEEYHQQYFAKRGGGACHV